MSKRKEENKWNHYKVESPIEKLFSCLQEVNRLGESEHSTIQTGGLVTIKYKLAHAYKEKRARINKKPACNHFLASAWSFSMANKRLWLCCFLLLIGIGEFFIISSSFTIFFFGNYCEYTIDNNSISRDNFADYID